jgi:hypothetical protein
MALPGAGLAHRLHGWMRRVAARGEAPRA